MANKIERLWDCDEITEEDLERLSMTEAVIFSLLGQCRREHAKGGADIAKCIIDQGEKIKDMLYYVEMGKSAEVGMERGCAYALETAIDDAIAIAKKDI